MIGFIFPGQGSQFVGMGKDLYENFPQCREIFDRADDILSFKLSKICFDGPEELLKQTENTQPALFIHSLAVFELLKNVEVSAAAGHSLGEYSALTAAESFNFEDGLKIVRKRGELMQQSGNRNPGTMAAIVGLSNEKLTELCESVSNIGVVQPANFNSPGQVVISGSKTAVVKVVELAKRNGAKLAKELVVSGAFHSPLMNYAYENISKELENVTITFPKFPVYSNVTSNPFSEKKEIKKLLIDQIISPVQWENIIKNMIRDGVKKFFEIGSGKVLSGLVKRIDSNIEVSSVGNVEEIKRFLG